MSVTKSKFESEKGASALDVDDPDFWSKVMPDFVTPEILINKLAEMEEAFEKPVGGRRPKAESNKGTSLSRGNTKKVKEYMVDLKGVMEDIFEQDQEGTLSAADKESCQRLLLMVSVKEKMFSKDQRNTAKKLLSRLEGDRRRKCRDSEGGRADRLSVGPSESELVDSGIRKELLIVSSKKKRTKRGTPRKGEDGKSTPRRDSDIDEDGFKVSKSTSVRYLCFIPRELLSSSFFRAFIFSFTLIMRKTGLT